MAAPEKSFSLTLPRHASFPPDRNFSQSAHRFYGETPGHVGIGVRLKINLSMGSIGSPDFQFLFRESSVTTDYSLSQRVNRGIS